MAAWIACSGSIYTTAHALIGTTLPLHVCVHVHWAQATHAVTYDIIPRRATSAGTAARLLRGGCVAAVVRVRRTRWPVGGARLRGVVAAAVREEEMEQWVEEWIEGYRGCAEGAGDVGICLRKEHCWYFADELMALMRSGARSGARSG